MCPASSSSRWCPTPEQLMILEEMYRNGVRTPNAAQIQHITAHLSFYGKIEGKNVFYWFQNHKARDKQKLRRKLNKQLQLQRQQQLNYRHHHLSQRNHFLYDLGSVSGSTSFATQQRPFCNSFGSFPERGAGEASKQGIYYPWKIGKQDASKENTMLTTFYNEDWTMMVDVGPPPCCCPNPLKTLELFPITDRLKAAEYST